MIWSQYVVTWSLCDHFRSLSYLIVPQIRRGFVEGWGFVVTKTFGLDKVCTLSKSLIHTWSQLTWSQIRIS